MKTLWDPTRHEKLGPYTWDESRALSYIAEVVNAALNQYRKSSGWPVDARDQMDGMPDEQANCLYYGAAGNIWALRRVEAALHRPLSLDLKSAAYKAYEVSQSKPDTDEPGFLISRGGSELLAYAFGFEDAAEDLTRSIEVCGSREEPKELFWGPPAGLLMAHHAYQIKNDPHWLKLLLKHGQRFLKNFGLEKQGVWQWPQVLYDTERPCTIGAAHGLVGAMLPYMLAYKHWPESMRVGIFDQLLSCIQDTAMETDAYANWPKEMRKENVPSEMLLQWCHGAPGIVSCLSHLPEPWIASALPLLKKAGEAIWSAGPLTKPAGLCHGTAGNAYALLRLYALTGDHVWLEKARLFGMHAIEQSQAEYARKGTWHYSLMTGDMGLLVFLADCIVGSSGHFPLVESFHM